MEFREFQPLMDELAEYFDPKYFQTKTRTVIFKIVKDLSPGEFSQVIEQLCETSTRAPAPAQIKQAALPLISRARERAFRKQLDDLERSGARCQYCDFTGFVTAISRTNVIHEFAFRCPKCPATKIRRHSFSIPFWNEEFRKDGYVPFSLRPDSFPKVIELQAAAQKRALTGDRAMGFAEQEILAMLERARRQPERED